ncbi:MAG: efflux RND transporter periplasmic adaptor subunit, partial [Rhodanobacter sp.]
MKRTAFCLALLSAVCGTPFAQEVAAPGDPLALDAATIKSAGIVLDKVARRVLTDELKAPGEVKVNAYSTVLVSPR